MQLSTFGSIMFPLRNTLHKWKPTIVSLAVGFYIGVFTQLVASEEVTSFSILLHRLLNRPLMWLLVLALLPIAVIWLVLPILDRYCRSRRWEVLLAQLTTSRVAPSVAAYSSSSISWGTCLTLQSCPDLHRGWPIEEVVLRYYKGGHRFVLDKADRSLYEHFREENRDKKWYYDDGPSFRLVKNPISFTDTPQLILEVQECRYSEVQYCNHRIAAIPDRQQDALKSILEGEANFPHTFGAHIVVLTSDHRVLATLGSSKKDYFGNLWSISIEEQLRSDDLSAPTSSRVSQWIARALSEELGVQRDDYIDENVRALSVFIEGHNLNFGLCVVAQLSISEQELSAIIEAKPRSDYEFTEFRFLGIEEIAELLHSPVGWRFHPTSEYRMFMTLVHRLGPVGAAKQIFKQ
jgi:hypothetical protein